MDKATANLIRERANDCCEYCKMPQEHDDLDDQVSEKRPLMSRQVHVAFDMIWWEGLA